MVQYRGVQDEIVSDCRFVESKYCKWKIGKWLSLKKDTQKSSKFQNLGGGGYKCDKVDILRYKKITYKKILCILVGTIEELLMKLFFASKGMRFPYTNIW